jgi:hypothetical protein
MEKNGFARSMAACYALRQHYSTLAKTEYKIKTK